MIFCSRPEKDAFIRFLPISKGTKHVNNKIFSFFWKAQPRFVLIQTIRKNEESSQSI